MHEKCLFTVQTIGFFAMQAEYFLNFLNWQAGPKEQSVKTLVAICITVQAEVIFAGFWLHVQCINCTITVFISFCIVFECSSWI